MKVIVAGFSKTGTKTLNAALTELGYDVYDYLEHFMFHYDEWKKISNGEGCVEDFKKMYKNVDAVLDAPAFLYWYEIHQAFPDAKIIFTTRDEMSWYNSLDRHLKNNNLDFESLSGMYSIRFVPIMRMFFNHIHRNTKDIGMIWKRGWLRRPWFANKMIALQKYRKHNACVLKEAPKDRLLVFNVKEGWEPLCKFLNKDVPDTPFPRENVGGANQSRQMSEHEFGKKVKQQTITSLIVFMLICVFVCYFLRQYPMWVGLSTFVSGFTLLWLLV